MNKIIFLLFIIITRQSFSQSTYQKTYSLDGFDFGQSIAPTGDGGFGATGSCLRIGDSHSQIYFLRTDSISNIVASGSYGSHYEHRLGNCIQQCSNGGFIIAGSSEDFYSGGYYVFLMRTNPVGQLAWFKVFGDVHNNQGYSVTQTIDGGFAIVGSTLNYSTFNNNIFLIRTDNMGNTLWTKKYYSSSDSYGFSIRQTFDGGFIIGGQKNNYASLIKTDSTGSFLWVKSFVNYAGGYCNSVQQTSDSGFIMTGYLQDSATYFPKVFLLKTNSVGDTLWTKKYGGNKYDVANSVCQTSDSGFIIAGFTSSFGVMDSDVYLIRTKPNGDTLWTKTYGDNREDIAYSVFQTKDGGFLAGGYSKSFGGFSEVYVIKTDPMGNSGCNERVTQTIVSSPLFTVLTAPMSSSSGSIDSSSFFFIAPGGVDNLLCGSDVISEINSHQPTITIYPNPFNKQFAIRNSGFHNNGEIILFDITGKEMLHQHIISNATIINTEKISSGFYLLRYSDEITTVNYKVMKQ